MSTRNDVDLLAVSQFEFGKPLLSVSTVASIGAAMGSGHSIGEPAKNDRGCEAVIVGIKRLSTTVPASPAPTVARCW